MAVNVYPPANVIALKNSMEDSVKMFHKDQEMIKCCSKKVVRKNRVKMEVLVMNLMENVFVLLDTEGEGVIEPKGVSHLNSNSRNCPKIF